jgi:predicted aldo/keto reductase-like oxidoreductase
MPCPAGVNIPLCFAFYNNRHLFDDKNSKKLYLSMTIGKDGGKPSFASLCKECGRCEKQCPQHLLIRRHLKDVSREMEGFYFKPMSKLLHGYFSFRHLLSGKKTDNGKTSKVH